MAASERDFYRVLGVPRNASQEEIQQAREDWMTGSRFGEVKGYDGAPLPAPELPPVGLKPRGRVR